MKWREATAVTGGQISAPGEQRRHAVCVAQGCGQVQRCATVARALGVERSASLQQLQHSILPPSRGRIHDRRSALLAGEARCGIDIGRGAHQQLNALRLAGDGSVHEWSRPIFATQVTHSTRLLKKRLQHRRLAEACREQHSAAILAGRVHVGAAAQQLARCAGAPILTRAHQRREAVAVLGFERCASLHKLHDHLGVPLLGSHQQRCRPIVTGHIDAGACSEERAHARQVAAARRAHQGCHTGGAARVQISGRRTQGLLNCGPVAAARSDVQCGHGGCRISGLDILVGGDGRDEAAHCHVALRGREVKRAAPSHVGQKRRGASGLESGAHFHLIGRCRRMHGRGAILVHFVQTDTHAEQLLHQLNLAACCRCAKQRAATARASDHNGVSATGDILVLPFSCDFDAQQTRPSHHRHIERIRRHRGQDAPSPPLSEVVGARSFISCAEAVHEHLGSVAEQARLGCHMRPEELSEGGEQLTRLLLHQSDQRRRPRRRYALPL
mmetsp:Transcript_32495/g.107451  ORF Transcript_32495/g.107451 Transcript_32495/m.107451 type:complete len:500 (-) Transcript_32495:166-1665(-)